MLHVGVGIEQLLCLFWHGIFQGCIFLLGCLHEEGIVEVDDVAVGAIVGVERLDVELFLWIGKLRLDVVE